MTGGATGRFPNGAGAWVRHLVVAALVAGVAAMVVPFTSAPHRILVPEGLDLDATQEALLIADGIDRLASRPLAYYDTDILYPDHHQLRSTEPFIGFALLGAPLRLLTGADPAHLFEALRWLVVFLSLIFAYLWFDALGVDSSLAVAGALLCATGPGLLGGIERLQVLGIGLVFPALYCVTATIARPTRARRAASFVTTALYPLCGMYNATIAAIALLLLLPVCLRAAADRDRRARLRPLLLPLVLAMLVDAVILSPWLTDRADLAVYVSEPFLRIKDWNTTPLPEWPGHVADFASAALGAGLLTTLALVPLAVVADRITAGRPTRHSAGSAWPWFVLVPATALLVWATSRGTWGAPAARAAVWAFYAATVATYVAWLRMQVRVSVGADADVLSVVGKCGVGLALFLCLASFGPLHANNASPLATPVVNALLTLFPPLRQMREFQRLWLAGVLVLDASLVLTLAAALRGTPRPARWAAALLLVGASAWAAGQRTLVATDEIVAPADFLATAAHSTSRGAIYVHPYMKWNSPSGVSMIAIAKALGRPVVNGYLGIQPPWFAFATRVLHRFPDPEALWLLRHWEVDTVVSLAGDVHVDAAQARTVHVGADGVVYEMMPAADAAAHPSIAACTSGDAPTRIELPATRTRATDEGNGLQVIGPAGFAVSRVEIAFGPTLDYLNRVPDAIAVFADRAGDAAPLNQEPSGRWIESLTADALLRRTLPLVTIVLNAPQDGPLRLAFHDADRPVVRGVAVCGRWLSGSSR